MLFSYQLSLTSFICVTAVAAPDSHFLFLISQVPHGGAPDSTLLRGLSWLRGVTDAVCIPKLILEGGLALSFAKKVNHPVGWGMYFSPGLSY